MIVIPYKPRPFQLTLHEELEKYRWALLFIHRRFGKTVMLINHLIREALRDKQREPRYAFIAPYFKQGKALAWDYLKYYTGVIPGVLVNESELRIDIPFNGARIRIWGADNADGLRGLYLDGVVMDEYPLMDRDVFPSIIRPCLSDRKGFAVMSGTPNGKNHAYELLQKAKGMEDFYTSVLKASETGVLDAEELASARAMMGEEAYLREYECSFEASSGKLVYPEFSSSLHVSREATAPKYAAQIIRGWDNTGLSPAIVLTYINGLGQWVVFKEFTFEDTGIIDAAEAMLIWCNKNLSKECVYTDYADPAGRNRDSSKQSPRDYIMKKAHEMMYDLDLRNGIQTWQVRKESVRSRLTKLVSGKPGMIINPECKVLIEGFEGAYKYSEIGNSGEYKTTPEKNHVSHIHDALQYPATMLFSSIKSIEHKSVKFYTEKYANAGVW